MNRIFAIGFLGLILLLAASVSGLADSGGTVSAPNLFSYQEPSGWTAKDTPISKYPVSFDAPHNSFAANINVVAEPFAGSLDDYVAATRKALATNKLFSKFQIVEEKPFQTTAGINGVRWIVRDTLGTLDMQQVFYFFSGSSNKLVVTASSLVGDGDHYAPIFDTAMKTFAPQ